MDDVEELKKLATQRGARMQIMRDYMASALDVDGNVVWWRLLRERPEVRGWFDEEGVPK